MSSPHQFPQPVEGLPVRPAGEPHVADGGAENLRALGVEEFAQAVLGARVIHGHPALIVPVGDDVVKVCGCGWLSASHVTEADAMADPCPIAAGERERAIRAGRDGREVIEALRLMATRAR